MVPPPSTDENHLRLLSICYYIMGGLRCFGSLAGVALAGVGAFLATAAGSFPDKEDRPFPPELGWLFVVIGILIFLLNGALGIFTIMAGQKLARRTHYMFTFVMACIECLFVPLGTVLGIFTLVVLSRESVKRLFEGTGAGAQPLFPPSTPTPPGSPPAV